MYAITYSEPNKLPAGLMALAVHGAFFIFLYFGTHWQAQPPQAMTVDLWDSLPDISNTAAKISPPKVEEALPKPVKPVELPKPVEPLPPVAPAKNRFSAA